MITRMIRTVNEKRGALSPETLAQPAKFKQIVVDLEEDNPKDVSCPANYKPGEESADQMQQRSPWTSSFKFSVSRLPKWAQANVEPAGIATKCQNSSSDQKHEDSIPENLVDTAEESRSSMHIHYQTPTHGSRSNESCLSSQSKSSGSTTTSVLQGDAPSQKKEKTHWNTIYNVCLDMINSPNIQTSFIKQPKAENVGIERYAGQEDTLKQFDNTLPMIDEADVEKSWQRRRYSSQFVLRRDYISGTKQFLRTPLQKSVHQNLCSIQEHSPLGTVKDQSSQNSEERHKQSKSSLELTNDTVANDSVHERIASCRQALHGLNAAAAVFVQSMSELSTADPGDQISKELRAEFMNETALMIPEISQKVNEVVAKMLLNHKNRNN